MTEFVRVICQVDRYWDSETRKFAWTESPGTLVGISVQGDASGGVAPVGVVMLDSGAFYSLPVEFIKREII